MSWVEAVVRVLGWSAVVCGGFWCLVVSSALTNRPDGRGLLMPFCYGVAAVVLGLIPLVKYHYDAKHRAVGAGKSST